MIALRVASSLGSARRPTPLGQVWNPTTMNVVICYVGGHEFERQQKQDRRCNMLFSHLQAGTQHHWLRRVSEQNCNAMRCDATLSCVLCKDMRFCWQYNYRAVRLCPWPAKQVIT